MLRPRWAAMGKALRRRAFAGRGRNSAFTHVAARTCFYDDAVTRAGHPRAGPAMCPSSSESTRWDQRCPWPDSPHTLRDVSGPGSRLVVNFGLGTRAANSRGSRPALVSRIALALQGEPITFQPPPEDAPDFITDTGWTTRELLTAPDLIQRYLPGTDLPTAKVNPTTFAVEATTAR